MATASGKRHAGNSKSLVGAMLLTGEHAVIKV
jgi:hypothetical protein